MQRVALLTADWRDPGEVLQGFAEEPFALALLSGGGGIRGRWSYLARRPALTLTLNPADPGDAFARMAALLGPDAEADADGPPFQGGLAGLMGYELAARLESAGHGGHPDWPQLACGLYPAVLAFDHQARRVIAVGRGEDAGKARARAEAMLELLSAPAAASAPQGAPLSDAFEAMTPGEAYEHSVADVVRRIGEGEIFQANIARAWGGRLLAGVTPADLVRRLVAASPAPFGAYFRLPGRAVVSNSPERFVRVSAEAGLRVETRPIKGTRPRGSTAEQDESLRQELLACEKDRAENLMIVDLMRNDLARVCPPGTVEVTELFQIESFANVHHLVSAVTGRLAPGLKGLDLFEAAFPPGSITGAPKVQAIKVIADYEGPRGPYCGSIFWAGLDGAADSSVLIRTVGLIQEPGGWRFEARAGAGIVADSDPHCERLETEAKIDAIRRAMLGEKA
ncbi:MAG TPA: anthranilate synthase component I family protein [Caulobacteraceae bacterium]